MAQSLTDLPEKLVLEPLDQLWVADSSEPPGSKDKVATVGALAAFMTGRYIDEVDPGPDDDETEGYGLLSLGLNTATESVFICVDPTEGAAVWVLLYAGGS